MIWPFSLWAKSAHPDGPQLPPECVHGSPITGHLLDKFWAWIDGGCHLAENASREATMLKSATTADKHVLLAAMAGHGNPWMRLAVVNNPATPVWALWGDGVSGFGLAGDPDPWVRYTLLMRYPQPPASIMEKVVDSVRRIERLTESVETFSYRSI